nr:major histocompatibility complex class I-related gene protein-like [Misgurnus anguillicaudatus]
MRSVALLLPVIHLAFAGHSLQYFYTVVSGDINFPEFTGVGFVDDQQFIYFDSKIKKPVPKTEWIRTNEGEDYWNRETNMFTTYYWEYKNEMQIIMDRFNHSEGVHTLQVMYGCELEDDGTTRGYYKFGYDGEDFINFDKNTLIWTSANPQAKIIKNKWNRDRAKAEHWKIYLENTCFEWLRKYVSYGKNTLERKDAPQVSLLQKDSSSPVICHATGFYPNNIMMTWKKNEEDHNEDVDVSSILPNDDGTFQKRMTLSLKPEEWKKNPDVYRCVVQHVGADKEIVVLLNENNIKSNSGTECRYKNMKKRIMLISRKFSLSTELSSDNIVVSGLFVVYLVVPLLLLLAAVCAFIIWLSMRIMPSLTKTKSSESTATNSEKSDSSSELLPQPVKTKRFPPLNKLKKLGKK